MTIRFINTECIKDVCSGWVKTGSIYEMTSVMDEYIDVDESNGCIYESGYDGLVTDWILAGLVVVEY